MTSWKTTAGGALAMLGGFVAIGNMFMSGQLDPTQLSLAIAAIGSAWTGFMAKDHNVSNAPTPVPPREVSVN